MSAVESITVRYLGRRTGLPRSCRVRVARVDGSFVIRVGRPEEKRWWRNFMSPWPVALYHAGRLIHGTGVAVGGASEEGARLAGAYFSRYHVSSRHPEQTSRERLTFVRVTPRSLPPDN